MPTSLTLDYSAARTEIAGMGSTFGLDQMIRTRSLLKPLVERLPWATTSLVADVSYGQDSRHRLDIAPAARLGSPVLVFLHGGGFIAGDKNSDGIFYCNVPRYFAAHGYLGIAMNYRLAATAGWPAGAEDLSAAIRWVREHAAEYGGDPSRIVLLGQSAGATHAATWLFDPSFAPEADGIRAAVLMSGFYRPEAPLSGGPLQYYGSDPDTYTRRSVTAHVRRNHLPLLLTVAEYDPAPIAEQTLALAMALNKADGSPPRMLWAQGENHVSGVHGLGLGNDPIGAALRSFFSSAL